MWTLFWLDTNTPLTIIDFSAKIVYNIKKHTKGGFICDTAENCRKYAIA